MRATARIAGVSLNTVTKLLVEAGRACEDYHHRMVRGLRIRRVECDEAWTFAYARARRRRKDTIPMTAPEWAGDVWTWTALDPDSKMLVSWLVGDRDDTYAHQFMADLRSRIEGRVQITTDGYKVYKTAVEAAFGADADFAQILKVFVPGEEDHVESTAMVISGAPDKAFISTSLVERMNRTLRMRNRRYTRKTDAFSKKLENHRYSLALSLVHYNFIQIHSSIKTTPAVQVGLDERPRKMEWILEMVEERRPARAPWGSKREKVNVSTYP